MDLTRWPHADDILDRALELPPADRRVFVREAAGGDADLVSALDAILAEAETDDGFLAPGGAIAGAVAADLAEAARDDVAPRLDAGTAFGAYQVGEAIGHGGMGEVYRARDTRLGREVALKVLPRRFASDPVRHARFDREARLLASLNHPHIAAIYDVEEHDGVVALVLELVDGPTLTEMLAGARRLPLDKALRIAGEIGEALAAAHARGIVHRDLKPSNIKLTPAGDVKVLDFGIAKALAADTREAEGGSDLVTASITADRAAGGVVGTAPYVSPEHARGQPTDHRSDIWAFGCVLYEMVTGARAFDGDSTTEVIARVLERDPDFSRLPPDTPPSLRRLLARAFRKDPARRLGVIGDALLDIDDARQELVSRPDEVAVPASRRLAAWAAVAALIVGAAGGAAVVWQALGSAPARPTYLAVPVAEVDDLVAGESPSLAISPDGRSIVYRAWRDGVIQLVRQDLDTGQSEPVPGSIDASAPFFSPDGQWVGFTTQEQIMRAPMDGGQAIAVASSAGGARGTWTADDSIVFSSDAGRGIYRVPAVGGDPKLVASPDVQAGHVLYDTPAALPDGHHVLLNVRLADRELIGVLDLESGAVSTLTEGRQAQHLNTGHLVFARGEELWTASFDEAGLSLSGNPAPMVTDLERGSLNGTSHFAVSDTGTLVYMPRRPALDLKTPVWVSMDGRETPVKVESRPYTRASLSPDGSRIALAEADPENRDIWVLDIERGNLMRLTTDPAIDTAPIWSPDGRQIAFRSERGGGGIFITSADGSGKPTQLTALEGPSRPAQTPYDFTADGLTLLFTELRSYADQGIGSVSVLDAPRVMMLIDGPYAETRPSLSPDGAWLAYQSDETGRYEVYVRPYPNVYGSRTQISTAGGTSPHWRADGRAVIYHDGTYMMSAPVAPGDPFVVGAPQQLFEASRFSDRLGPVYDISPDGERFLFLREGGPEGRAGRRDDLRLIQNWTELLKK